MTRATGAATNAAVWFAVLLSLAGCGDDAQPVTSDSASRNSRTATDVGASINRSDRAPARPLKKDSGPTIVRRNNMERLDTRPIQEAIEASITSHVKRETKVRCPRYVPLKKGKTFDCELQIEGVLPATVRVTQTDAKGQTRWKIV